MPRINPAPTSALEPKTTPVVTKAASPIQARPSIAVEPPVAKPAENRRPLPTDETPLLPEQQAFQLPDSFIGDVQRIAAKAGYVGLTPSAIQRAYLQGEGLFVDTSA